MENNEEVISTIIIGFMKFKSDFYGISKKIKNALENGFRFNEIVEVAKKLIQVYQI